MDDVSSIFSTGTLFEKLKKNDLLSFKPTGFLALVGGYICYNVC